MPELKLVHPAVQLMNSMGGDLTVVNAARVSFGKESSFLSEQDRRLIGYLAKHKHWTPFAHVQLQFRIKAPVFVARQLIKHQIGLVWNEVSRRYVDTPPEFYLPDTWRGRPVNAKQGSDGEVDVSHDVVASALDQVVGLYQYLIDQGVAPEQARMVLPQNMMTEWVWTGSLAAFARVAGLRLAKDAQKETRDVVADIAFYCAEIAPVSWAALTGNQ